MAARLLGIATRTISRHLERQEGVEHDHDADGTDADTATETESDAVRIQ
jgi:hypothetical protein